MIAQQMVDRSVSVRQVALRLGVDESTLRYRLGRSLDASDGRVQRARALAGWDERIDAVLTRFADARLVPFDFEAVIAGERRALHGLIGTLSHCRATFVWISPTMTQVAWQTGHLALFTRYGGVLLWVRIDNLKTGVASGAGANAVITPAFATFARTCGFSVDPCRARTGSGVIHSVGLLRHALQVPGLAC